MVIEVVKLPKGKKTHAINEDNPRFTLCGSWVSDNAEKLDGPDVFPMQRSHGLSVMKS